MTDFNQLVSSNLNDRVSSRPDRNTHNGQTAKVHPSSPNSSEVIADAIYQILNEIGEDPEREGLLKTPKRVAEAMRFLTQGYNQSLRRWLTMPFLMKVIMRWG